jgi:hypothetical protein
MANSKLLFIDKKYAIESGEKDSIVLLPGYDFDPPWKLPFEKHSVFNKEIIKAKQRLAELFSEKIYSVKLGFPAKSCEPLFLSSGGLYTYVIADRLLRLNRLFKKIPKQNVVLPVVQYKHDTAANYKYNYYSIVEQNPYFNQWILNQLLPFLPQQKTTNKGQSYLIDDRFHFSRYEKFGILLQIQATIRKKLLKEGLSTGERIHGLMRSGVTAVMALPKHIFAKLSVLQIQKTLFNGEIAWDNLAPMPHLMQDNGFLWPEGPLVPLNKKLPSISKRGSQKVTRSLFLEQKADVAKIFKDLLINSKEEIFLPESTFENISNLFSILLPKVNVELAEHYCNWAIKELKPFRNKAYFCASTYSGNLYALRLFACNVLNINVLATQHSAWGGYLANGAVINEVLVKGCNDYITFGWKEKASGESAWKGSAIPMSSPLISELGKTRFTSNKVTPARKHILLCPGFLFRFPAIYNSFLRWDTVNEWSSTIEEIIQELSRSRIKITLKIYNNIVAESLRPLIQRWINAGGSYIEEYSNHDARVRYMLEEPDFEKKYDAVVWDLPTGGFTETIITGRRCFALWDENLLKGLPEGEAYINELLNSGVLFENGKSLVKSLEKLYKDSSWYDSKPVQDSITNFMEKFLKTNPNWVEEWKTFFSEYVKR